MSDDVYDGCGGLAADAKVETPEGAMTAKGVAGKAIPVFARDESGRVRFRMVVNARKVAEAQPVLKISLENGGSFRVAPTQVLFRKGMEEVAASALQAGDELVAAFHYPEGYGYRDDASAEDRLSAEAWRVVSVEPAGEADLYRFGVGKAGNFFFSAGVLGKAEA